MACSQHPRASGFSLLEMIVATALMGLAVVGLLSLISGSLSNAARVREYDRAAMLARTKMNELLVVSPLPLGETLSGNFDAGWSWEARVEPFELATVPHTGAAMLARVRLAIRWKAENRQKSIELDGYRKMTILAAHQNALSGLGP